MYITVAESMVKALPDNISFREKYDPFTRIVDQAEFDRYFEICVQHTMTFGIEKERAVSIERENVDNWLEICGSDGKRIPSPIEAMRLALRYWMEVRG